MAGMSDVVDRIIEGAGGLKSVLETFRITRQAVDKWRKSGVPPKRVIPAEALSGVPRHEIRSDLYPPPLVRGRRNSPRSSTTSKFGI